MQMQNPEGMSSNRRVLGPLATDRNRHKVITALPVLVASPDRLLCRSVFTLLESHGLAFQESCDFQSAITSLLFGGPFSAVILDADVSQFGSQLLARLIIGVSMALPCIVITGSKVPGWATNMPLVQRPVDPASLWSALNSSLAGRTNKSASADHLAA